ncbi:MAG: dephospho-CoA kinase [Verrucomicrobia bacterium]|nr:dephospho-CoA kinase [Verrucomicrobiota bacterium]MCF7708064.1 dephospho-CoA kinase [Verrucomicrobiota bacterium]
MNVIGLTGGIGMGKSTAAKYISEYGIPVVDTDSIARELVMPGAPALQEITETFGAQVIDESGELKRTELAKTIFSNPGKRRKLESILHPKIRHEWLTRTKTLENEEHRACAVVIPLLFEIGGDEAIDIIICVATTKETQRNRLRLKGMTDSDISGRIAAQKPIEYKMTMSDFVVWNESSPVLLRTQIFRILDSITGKRS